MSGWDAALDAQHTLRNAFQTSEGMAYLTSLLNDMMKTPQWSISEQREVPHNKDLDATASLIRGMLYHLDGADPVWVNEDVVELVEAAAKTFEPQAVYLDDLFVPGAFCLLEKPMYITDRKGKRAAISAIQWGPADSRMARDEIGPVEGADSLLLAFFTHRDHGDDYAAPGELPYVAGSPLVPMHVNPLTFGPSGRYADPSGLELLRLVQVLWQLAKQEVAVPGMEHVSRPTWRRAARDWRQIKHVKVMTLRRAKPKHGDGERGQANYSHRFWVDGHWRKQWYPSLKDHRQIWINGYVKGDEDLPFVAKQRAIEFVR